MRKGEKYKIFYWVRKKKSVKKCITVLKTKDGKKVTGVNTILKELVNYYSQLYTSDN